MDTDGTQMIKDEASVQYPLKDLTEKVIGAAFEVHNQLGAGFLERVYENALLIELRSRGVDAAAQVEVPVSYKGTPVGLYLADLVIGKDLICEIKAAKDLARAHEAQIINYLKGTGIKVGLLLNFGRDRLQFRRFVF
jgi:GxxExxY protein